MGKSIMQFRFYGDPEKGNENNSHMNYPTGLTPAQLYEKNNIFSDYMPVLQLGVQGLPGTKFYINESENPVIIGYSGVYELDIGTQMQIRSLQFDKDSLEAINSIPTSYLIVDILYENDNIADNANINAPDITLEANETSATWGILE